MNRVVVAPWRGRAARFLLLIASLIVVFSFSAAINAATTAAPDDRVVETWLVFGQLVFAGIFVLLAVWPRNFPGVWELAIFHKAGVAIAAALMVDGTPDARGTAVVEGLLAVLLIVAYVLAKGYTAWGSLRGE